MSKLHQKTVAMCYGEFNTEGLEYCDVDESKEYEDMLRSGKPLPSGIYRDPETAEFYRDLPSEELQAFLLCKQTQYLKTIKKYVILTARLVQIGIAALLLILIASAF